MALPARDLKTLAAPVRRAVRRAVILAVVLAVGRTARMEARRVTRAVAPVAANGPGGADPGGDRRHARGPGDRISPPHPKVRAVQAVRAGPDRARGGAGPPVGPDPMDRGGRGDRGDRGVAQVREAVVASVAAPAVAPRVARVARVVRVARVGDPVVGVVARVPGLRRRARLGPTARTDGGVGSGRAGNWSRCHRSRRHRSLMPGATKRAPCLSARRRSGPIACAPG